MACRGNKMVFGGMFGEAHIVELSNIGCSVGVTGFGGRIPAPSPASGFERSRVNDISVPLLMINRRGTAVCALC
jgi:hypothetical protein